MANHKGCLSTVPGVSVFDVSSSRLHYAWLYDATCIKVSCSIIKPDICIMQSTALTIINTETPVTVERQPLWFTGGTADLQTQTYNIQYTNLQVYDGGAWPQP